jgi:hypothetical protein
MAGSLAHTSIWFASKRVISSDKPFNVFGAFSVATPMRVPFVQFNSLNKTTSLLFSTVLI